MKKLLVILFLALTLNTNAFADNMIGNILQGTQAAIDDMIKHDVIEEHPPNQPDPWI